MTQQSNIFGQTTAFGSPSNTNVSSIFGGTIQNENKSIFGTATNTAETSSLFSSSIPKPDQSVFGSPTGNSNSGTSIFGSSTTVTPAFDSSPFGTPAQQQQNTGWFDFQIQKYIYCLQTSE